MERDSRDSILATRLSLLHTYMRNVYTHACTQILALVYIYYFDLLSGSSLVQSKINSFSFGQNTSAQSQLNSHCTQPDKFRAEWAKYFGQIDRPSCTLTMKGGLEGWDTYKSYHLFNR